MKRVAELAQQYTDVPTQVLLKADLLFAGIRINEAMIEAGSSALPHFWTAEHKGRKCAVPYFLHIPDGRGDGGELLVLVRPSPSSPYRIERSPGGGYVLMEESESVCSALPAPKPAWYVWAEREGLRRARAGLEQHGDMLVANLTPACDYWAAPGEATGHRCLFCGYGAVSVRSETLEQKRATASPAPATLAEFKRALPQSRAETRHLYLVGGSVRDLEAEGARYLQVTEAAVEAEPSYRGAIGCGSQALPKAWSKRIHAAGAAYACFNLEVWDEALWAKICPGKAKFIGREAWIRNMVDAVDVFGRGAVLTALVAGAELVPPLGLSSVDRAIESSVKGTDWLLDHGIVPIYSLLSPAITSEYSRAAAPDIHYFLRLNRETFKLRRRHQLPLDARFVCSGCTYAQIECDLDRLA